MIRMKERPHERVAAAASDEKDIQTAGSSNLFD